MTLADYTAVYALWISCKGMGLNTIDDSESGIKKFLKRNTETCFIAEDDSEIVGVIIAGNDGRRGYIYHTAVSPAHRHQGIATKLLNTALNAFCAIGIAKVALVVFDRNADGNAFWEKQGFTRREDLIYRNKSLMEMERIDT
ncbi:MAG: GNAT family N-acetyltransferase [Oscillospiraceae bacterium]